jgi:uncharacterized protein (DUF697 family)
MLDAILERRTDEWTESERREAMRGLVQAASASAAVAALQPIPFLDPVLLTPIQVGMVQAAARIHGYPIDKKSALELLKSFRVSLLARHLVIAGAKFVPTLGALVSAPLAYALTSALGEFADRYFERGRSMPPAEMRDTLDRLYRAKVREIYAAKGRAVLGFFRHPSWSHASHASSSRTSPRSTA